MPSVRIPLGETLLAGNRRAHVFSLDDAKSQVQEQTSRNEEPDLIVVIPQEIRAQVGGMAFKEAQDRLEDVRRQTSVSALTSGVCPLFTL